MSISIKTEIIGGKELERALRELGEAAGQKGGPVKLALKHAAEPVLAAMKAKAVQHTQTRLLLNALKSQRIANPRLYNEIYAVGVYGVGKRPPKDATDKRATTPWYAYVVEYGGWHNSGPLKGFIRNALENNQNKVNTIYLTDLRTGINKIAKKIGNKNAQVVEAKVRARTTASGLKIRTNF